MPLQQPPEPVDLYDDHEPPIDRQSDEVKTNGTNTSNGSRSDYVNHQEYAHLKRALAHTFASSASSSSSSSASSPPRSSYASIPPFEVNAETVHVLDRWLREKERREQRAQLRIDDMQQRIHEYRSERTLCQLLSSI